MTVINTRIIEKIDFTDNGVHFNVSLPGRVTVLSGNNASGKTLLRQRFKMKSILEAEMHGLEDKVVTFDIFDNHDLQQVKDIKHKFIIIDNGDSLLATHNSLVDYINADFDNQYLIFSRGETGIRTNPNNRGRLVANGKEIKAVFD